MLKWNFDRYLNSVAAIIAGRRTLDKFFKKKRKTYENHRLNVMKNLSIFMTGELYWRQNQISGNYAHAQDRSQKSSYITM